MNAKDAIDLTVRIKDLIKKGANLEAEERIMELRSMVISLSEENISLRGELLKLRDDKKKQESLRYDTKQEAYYMDGEDDPGPYCQYCLDNDQKLARLRGFEHWSGFWHCSICDKSFGPSKAAEVPDSDRPVKW